MHVQGGRESSSITHTLGFQLVVISSSIEARPAAGTTNFSSAPNYHAVPVQHQPLEYRPHGVALVPANQQSGFQSQGMVMMQQMPGNQLFPDIQQQGMYQQQQQVVPVVAGAYNV